MGYTHYFTVKEPVPTEVWGEVLKAKQLILAASPVPIDDETFGDGVIVLNGVAPDDFETFYIDPDEPGWAFCKTGRRPYDVVVVAILCAIDQICGAYFIFESDGEIEDWLDGQDLASKALGYLPIPSTINDR